MKERDFNNTPTVSYTRGNDLSSTMEGLPRERNTRVMDSMPTTHDALAIAVDGGTSLSRGKGGIGGLLARSSGYSGGNWTTHNFYFADGNGSPREITTGKPNISLKHDITIQTGCCTCTLSHGVNITYMLNSSQAMVAKYRYDPFGNTISSSGTLASANIYRFSSKEIHANSAMYYYGRRFLDCNLHRWINRDPISEKGGLICSALWETIQSCFLINLGCSGHGHQEE